ncbi:GyrI-like domain-containing protein [Cellulomonas sp. P22]|uniref:GyrI-like domain-containing protein n=1 Tax=Cellulomonas sp. P22 TaxID=3373189 RepID=UPI00378C4459
MIPAPGGKTDLMISDRSYYLPPAHPTEIVLPSLGYVAINGRGEPGGAAHRVAVDAIDTTLRTLKARARARGQDFAIAKHEGLWWNDEGELVPPARLSPYDWNWTMLVRLPEFVDATEVAAAAETSRTDRPWLNALADIRATRLTEGRCVQMLHVGPYADRPETMTALTDYMDARGLVMSGRHHEIYLSDPLRVSPARLRTVLRYPVVARH